MAVHALAQAQPATAPGPTVEPLPERKTEPRSARGADGLQNEPGTRADVEPVPVPRAGMATELMLRSAQTRNIARSDVSTTSTRPKLELYPRHHR